MYVYLKPISTSGASGARYLIESIYHIVVSGWNITNTNGSYINHGMSYIAGSRPTAGIYTSHTAPEMQSFQDNYNNNGYCAINKKSYATGQGPSSANAAYTPSRIIQVSYGVAPYIGSTNTSYPHYARGFRCNMGSSSFGNFYPYSNSSNVHTWGTAHGGSTTDTTNGLKIGNDGLNDLDSIHMIVNDTTFMILVVSSGSPTTQDQGWFCVNDLEHNGTYDNYAYSSYSTYCPTPVMWSSWQNVMSNPTLTAHATTPTWGMSMPQYVDQNGVLRNSGSSDMSDQNGWGDQDTTYNDTPSIFPSPRNNVYSMKGPGGEDIHPLIPLQYKPHQDHVSFGGDPRQGRLMNIYRTSNNDFDRGDVILDGSVRYRAFKTHKTGHADKASAIQNATYAFPEDNVPFS